VHSPNTSSRNADSTVWHPGLPIPFNQLAEKCQYTPYSRNAKRQMRDKPFDLSKLSPDVKSRFSYINLDNSGDNQENLIKLNFDNELMLAISYFARSIKLVIKNLEIDELIANFQIDRAALDSWQLRHRYVHEYYRKCQLGSQLLNTAELAISSSIKGAKFPQILKINTGQLSVINFALKNGYELDQTGTRELTTIINDILQNPNSQYIITGITPEFRAMKDCAEENPQWYIFPKAIFDFHKHSIWFDDYIGNILPPYIRLSQRFELTKTLATTY